MGRSTLIDARLKDPPCPAISFASPSTSIPCRASSRAVSPRPRPCRAGSSGRGHRRAFWRFCNREGFGRPGSRRVLPSKPIRANARPSSRPAMRSPITAGPMCWSLDDYPHFEFLRTPQTVLPGLQSARAVMANWLDEFRYMSKSVDWGILTYTMHPYVIGRGYRMLALEDVVDALAREGAVFVTMEDAAQEAKVRIWGA